MNTEKLISIRESAKQLNVSHNTMRRWIKDGRIKAVKLGRMWRITQAEMDRIVSEGLIEKPVGGES